MYKGLTPKDSESVNSWFFSCPHFVRSHPTDCFGRASVLQESSSGQGLAQNLCGKFTLTSIDLAVLTRVRFIRYATPFCSGFFGNVNSWCTPSAVRCASNSLEVNSPPLSVRIALSFLLVDFSTMAFHSRNFSNTWSLDFKK